MTNNRADSMLMPVIDGKVRSTAGVQQRQLGEIDFIRAVVAGRGFGRRSRFVAVAKRGQAKASRDHPQQEMRPEIPSAKLSPARQQSTHVRYL